MKQNNAVKPRLMGILNVTPDSFSDGGRYFPNEQRALARAVEMAEQGADLIDIGGESTRPGSLRIAGDEQKRRILNVIGEVARTLPGIDISVDTTLSEVADAALDAGAGLLNDVSAGRDDPAMFELAAQRGVPICLMHMQGQPETMQDNPRYHDVVSEVCAFLKDRIETALRYGVKESQIVLDPGIGFGKTLAHNLELIAGLEQIVEIGFPVLLGASRKRFIDALSQSPQPDKRMAGSCAVSVLGLRAGVSIFRVHDVFDHKQALDVAYAVLTRTIQ